MIPLIILILLIVSDQLTKYIAFMKLRPIYQVKLINGFFNLTYVENRGAAFGALQGARWYFVFLAAVVVAAAVIYYIRMEKDPRDLWLRSALVLICGGTIGNVIDRVFRGYVVDFLDFIIFGYDFPVFNLADVFIVVGTMILAVGILIFEGKKK